MATSLYRVITCSWQHGDDHVSMELMAVADAEEKIDLVRVRPLAPGQGARLSCTIARETFAAEFGEVLQDRLCLVTFAPIDKS